VAYVHAFERDDRDQRRRGISRHVVGAGYTNVFVDINGPDSYSENHISAAYAYTPEDLVTFAVSARIFFSNSGVEGFGAVGTSVTGAIRFALSQNLTLALVMPDLFSRFSYDNGEDEEIERRVATAVSIRSIPRVAVEVGSVIAHSDLIELNAGAETDYLYNRLSLRAGVGQKRSGRTRSIPYFGFGLRGIDDRLLVHYSAGLDSDIALGNTHRFSLSFSL
jgi:hypothetical protein